MNKRRTIVLLVIVTVFMLGVTGCKKKDTDVKNPVEDQTEVEVPNDSDKPEVPVDDKDSEVDTEEPVEPIEPVEPVEPIVDMVDFETWAKQEGNEDVCMVVWNEELSTQEILLTAAKTIEVYKVQDNDRFAIPYRANIVRMEIEYSDDEIETLEWDNFEYLEISLPTDQRFNLYIYYENEEGENLTQCYSFK